MVMVVVVAAAMPIVRCNVWWWCTEVPIANCAAEKTARNEGWRRYSGNNSPSSGSSDNRCFRLGCAVEQFLTFDTPIILVREFS